MQDWYENPLVDEPLDSYKEVWRRYREWQLKWWREVVQNSIDAGATEIRLDAEEQPDGSWLLSCEDNGSGMSEEILTTKFFTIGGSGKSDPFGQSIGGFGEAKKLVAFAWPSWTIHTRDVLARGQYRYYDLEPAPYLSGTKVSVIMPPERHGDISSAMELLQRSSTKGVHFYINGERFSERLLSGKEIKDIDLNLSSADFQGFPREEWPPLPGTGTIYFNKSRKYGALYVRVNGLYMFTNTRFWDDDIGTVTFEVPGEYSKWVLQDNRDGFRSDMLGYSLDRIAKEIAVEGTKALKETKRFRKVWKGQGFGNLAGNDLGATDALRAMTPTPPPEPGKSLTIDRESIDDLIELVEEIKEGKRGMPQEPGVQLPDSIRFAPMSPEVLEVLARSGIPGRPTQEAVAQQLVWTPAFMVNNELDDYTVPSKFLPEDMSPKVEALLRVWADACRWVFMQLGAEGYYGVGFVFSEDAGAQYVQEEDGSKWLLINPLALGTTSEKVFSKSNREDMKWLYAAAIHEVTHMADGFYSHDVAFAYALTRNFALCADGFPTMMKIARAVKMRKPAPKPKKPRVPKGTVLVSVKGLYAGERAGGYPRVLSIYDRSARVGGNEPMILRSLPGAVWLMMLMDEPSQQTVKEGWEEVGLEVPRFFADYLRIVTQQQVLQGIPTEIPVVVSAEHEEGTGTYYEITIYPEEPEEVYMAVIGAETVYEAFAFEDAPGLLSEDPDEPPTVILHQWDPELNLLGAHIDGLPLPGEAVATSIPSAMLYDIAKLDAQRQK